MQPPAAALVALALVALATWTWRPAVDEVTRTAEDARREARDVEVRPAPGRGRGVFARRDLPRGTLVGPYPGRVRRGAEHRALVQAGALDNEYALVFWRSAPGGALDEDFVIDPRRHGGRGGAMAVRYAGATPFVNEPARGAAANLVWVWNFQRRRVEMWTARDVAAGEELTVCYGADYGRDYKTSCTAADMPRMAIGPGDARPRPWFDVVTDNRDPRRA